MFELDKEPKILGLITALVVSFVSGFISISQRIVRGHKTTFLWVVSEFTAAILCGYLMYDAYPALNLPQWATLPLCVAVAAHTGGRIFQEFEKHIQTRIQKYWDKHFP